MTLAPEDAIAAARALLPAWVIWSPLLATAMAVATTAALASLTVLWTVRRALRLPPTAHWTERARVSWPVRRALWFVLFLTMALNGPLAMGGVLSLPGPVLRLALHQALPALLVVAIMIAVENRLVRWLPLGTRLRSIATWVLVLTPGVVLAGVASFVSAFHGAGWLVPCLATPLVIAASMGGTLPAARWIGLAGAAPTRANAAMARAAAAVGAAPPPVLRISLASANAFALPLAGAVAVTDGALGLLDDEELSAVLAHELGHLREPVRAKLARAAVALLLPLTLLATPPVWLRYRSEGMLALVLSLLAVAVVFRRFSRRLEHRADEAGAGAGPAYARALERLYQHNLSPAVLGRSASHPDLYDRMSAAGAPPAWPRPARPARSLPTLLLLATVVAGGVAWVTAWRLGLPWCEEPQERELLVNLAVDGGPVVVSQLGQWHWTEGDAAGALAFYGAAEALAPDEPRYTAWRSFLLAKSGRCQEAEAALKLVGGVRLEPGWLETMRRAISSCEPVAP